MAPHTATPTKFLLPPLTPEIIMLLFSVVLQAAAESTELLLPPGLPMLIESLLSLVVKA